MSNINTIVKQIEELGETSKTVSGVTKNLKAIFAEIDEAEKQKIMKEITRRRKKYTKKQKENLMHINYFIAGIKCKTKEEIKKTFKEPKQEKTKDKKTITKQEKEPKEEQPSKIKRLQERIKIKKGPKKTKKDTTKKEEPINTPTIVQPKTPKPIIKKIEPVIIPADEQIKPANIDEIEQTETNLKKIQTEREILQKQLEEEEIYQEIREGNYTNSAKLSTITEEIAEHCGKYKENLDLSGVITLSDTCAQHLSTHQGHLDLYGLSTISDTVAEHLSKHQGSLDLHGLTAVSNTTAQHLGKHQGRIDLSGLTTLSLTAARNLAAHQGYLGLNGLTILSDTAIEHLATLDRDISLRGLRTLSDKAAEHLAKHKGSLDLRGLTTLSDIAAEHLAKHQDSILCSEDIQKKIDEYKNTDTSDNKLLPKPYAPDSEKIWLNEDLYEFTDERGITFKIGQEVIHVGGNKEREYYGKITGFNGGEEANKWCAIYTEKANKSIDKRPTNITCFVHATREEIEKANPDDALI